MLGFKIQLTASCVYLCCCAACEPELQLQLAEGHAYGEVIDLHKLKALLRIPSNWLIVAQVGAARWTRDASAHCGCSDGCRPLMVL